MPVERSSSLVGSLRYLWDGTRGSVVAATEHQLLDRFVTARDEAAFQAIVARHGPMVMGVCRAVLANPTDADDAFQATFLVLVQKAGSVRAGAPLSPWLHGIARKVALRARSAAAKRSNRESANPVLVAQAPDRPSRSTEEREQTALLHAEIDRLASPERSAILLCDLEGLTHQEAADQLGWPLGTVKSRVARGRDRLRSRLVRRGVTLSVPGLVATLAGEAGASVVVSQALQMGTTRAAVALGAAHRVLAVGLISTPVLNLTQGAVRAMIWTKIKVGALAVAATTVLAAPPLVAYPQAEPDGPARQKPVVVAGPAVKKLVNPAAPTGSPPPAGSSPIGDVRTRVAQAAVDSIAQHDRDKSPGAVPDDLRLNWYKRLAEAQVGEAKTTADRVQAVQAYLNRVQTFATDQARELAHAASNLHDIYEDGDPSWYDVWTTASKIDSAVKEAQRWLDQVQAEPVRVATPPALTAVPKTSGPQAIGGAIGASPYSPLPRNTPADEEKNRAILTMLERRDAMPFANETPLSDFIKYIQTSTIDETTGFPTGLPIYVDPQGLQDTDKTMASTISLNLEGVALRTTLKLALMQLNLTYIVENGLLLIVANNEDGEYSALLPHKPKAAAFGAPAGGFQ